MSSPPISATAYLVFEFERRAYPIGDAPFVIGRDAGGDIVIREPAVSRVHAEVHNVEGHLEIRPAGATATKVNGMPLVGPHVLEEGDSIEIGSMQLTFRRARLPLGVSIVDRARSRHLTPDVTTQRPTITNPILNQERPVEEPKKVRWILPVLLVLAIVVYFLFS